MVASTEKGAVFPTAVTWTCGQLRMTMRTPSPQNARSAWRAPISMRRAISDRTPESAVGEENGRSIRPPTSQIYIQFHIVQVSKSTTGR